MITHMNNNHKLTRKLNATYQGKSSSSAETKELTMFPEIIKFSRQRSAYVQVV